MPSNVRMTNIILFLDAEYHLILGCLILSNFRMPNAFKMGIVFAFKIRIVIAFKVGIAFASKMGMVFAFIIR